MKFVTVKNYLSKIVKNYLTFTPILWYNINGPSFLKKPMGVNNN